MIKKAILAIGIIIVLCIAIYLYGSHMAQRPPENGPESFLSSKIDRKDKKLLVCIGDSITHGRVSHNYMDLLAEKAGDKNLLIVNAGINSELAYNVLTRIDAVIRCKPDFVTILIGTNDANASLGPENSERAVRNMGLPRMPDREWFAENLSEICRRLKSETNAKIALLSIPPIGEIRQEAPFQAASEYSAVIRDMARREGCFYLPLNEKMTAYLEANPGMAPSPYCPQKTLMYTAIFRHFLLGESFDSISDRYGYLLLTDSLHLNGRAAEMVADLILEFIRKS